MALPLLQSFLFELPSSSIFMTALPAITLLLLLYLALSETMGNHLQYSKFWNVKPSSSSKQIKMSSRTGMLLLYTPAFLAGFASFFFPGGGIRYLLLKSAITLHFLKRVLEKYRLHTRRPSPSIHNSNNAQTPQFVVVGGIWMPPAEYAAMATTTTSGDAPTPNGIYAPIASLPQSIAGASNKRQKSEQFHSDERGSHSEGGTHSSSPETSSSTHTTTASPAF